MLHHGHLAIFKVLVAMQILYIFKYNDASIKAKFIEIRNTYDYSIQVAGTPIAVYTVNGNGYSGLYTFLFRVKEDYLIKIYDLANKDYYYECDCLLIYCPIKLI